jgi:hypothetical protein
LNRFRSLQSACGGPLQSKLKRSPSAPPLTRPGQEGFVFFAQNRAREPAPAGAWQKETNIMANILVSIEKGIEIGAEDALKWLAGADRTLKAAPAVIAALATLISAVDKPLLDAGAAAANPLNIALDIQTVRDVKAVWPEVKLFLASLGVKF